MQVIIRMSGVMRWDGMHVCVLCFRSSLLWKMRVARESNRIELIACYYDELHDHSMWPDWADNFDMLAIQATKNWSDEQCRC